MGWKSLIVVLACVSACLCNDLDRRKARERAARRYNSYDDIFALITPNRQPQPWDTRAPPPWATAAPQPWATRAPQAWPAPRPHAWPTPGPHVWPTPGTTQRPQPNPRFDSVQPYHESLVKDLEASRKLQDFLTPVVVIKPPINQIQRHRIALVYTIHYVASIIVHTPKATYDRSYHSAVDAGYIKGLFSPDEAQEELEQTRSTLVKKTQPVSDLINNLCGASRTKSIEACDLLVFMAVEIDPNKYKVPADIIVELAKVIDYIEPLVPEMKAAADDFTELAYLINAKEKLRPAITTLMDVYRKI